MKKLTLLPTCGTKFYEYDSAWTERMASENFATSLLSIQVKAPQQTKRVVEAIVACLEDNRNEQ